MTSELHVWFGEMHCFVGTMNDQPTEEECITADEESLESIRDDLVRGNPNLVALIETDGQETCLRLNGRKWLSFFRDGKES